MDIAVDKDIKSKNVASTKTRKYNKDILIAEIKSEYQGQKLLQQRTLDQRSGTKASEVVANLFIDKPEEALAEQKVTKVKEEKQKETEVFFLTNRYKTVFNKKDSSQPIKISCWHNEQNEAFHLNTYALSEPHEQIHPITYSQSESPTQ